MGAVFLKLLRSSQEAFKRVPALPARMALGGLLVGTIALAYPEVWGNGYVVTSGFIQHPVAAKLLLGIFLAKLLATVVTVGSGAVGGVYHADFISGREPGKPVRISLENAGLAPANLPVGIFALVGMGSMLFRHHPFAAAGDCHDFGNLAELFADAGVDAGCAVSTLVSQRLHPQFHLHRAI